MQAGQYHSAAEVLGGLYCAAITLFPQNNDPKNFNQISVKFEKLWEAFRDHPEGFFPMDLKNENMFNENVEIIVNNLKKIHMENVQQRKYKQGQILENFRYQENVRRSKSMGDLKEAEKKLSIKAQDTNFHELKSKIIRSKSAENIQTNFY
jgi:hypothetical protein